jgi:hypothetical protein
VSSKIYSPHRSVAPRCIPSSRNLPPSSVRRQENRQILNLTREQASAAPANPHRNTHHRPSPHLFAPRPNRANAMASRRLALNLQQSLRSKAAINAVKAKNSSPLTRGLATPVTYGTRTESTTLKNGFTVWRGPRPCYGTAIDRVRRSRPSTPRGHRRRRSVYGSMPEAGRRQTRPTELHTSWSTLRSR